MLAELVEGEPRPGARAVPRRVGEGDRVELVVRDPYPGAETGERRFDEANVEPDVIVELVNIANLADSKPILALIASL